MKRIVLLAMVLVLFTPTPAYAGTASDDFTRTVASGFGGSWSGPVCGSVDGAVGLCPSTPTQPRADRLATWTATTSSSDFSALVELKLDRAPTVGELTHGVKRLFSDGSYWFVELVARPGSLQLQLQTIIGGVKTTWENVAVPNVSAQTAWVWVWCSQNGTRIKGKAWEEGDPIVSSPLFDHSGLPSWVAQDGSLAVQFGHGSDEPGTAVHSIDNLSASWS